VKHAHRLGQKALADRLKRVDDSLSNSMSHPQGIDLNDGKA
jgi:hypothetical protein